MNPVLHERETEHVAFVIVDFFGQINYRSMSKRYSSNQWLMQIQQHCKYCYRDRGLIEMLTNLILQIYNIIRI